MPKYARIPKPQKKEYTSESQLGPEGSLAAMNLEHEGGWQFWRVSADGTAWFSREVEIFHGEDDDEGEIAAVHEFGEIHAVPPAPNSAMANVEWTDTDEIDAEIDSAFDEITDEEITDE